MEIFSNPYDLFFAVGENPDKPGTWGLALTRGPEHRGKLIATGEGYASKEDAIKKIVGILTFCIEKGSEIAFGTPKDIAEDLFNAIANPNGRNPEEMMNMLTTQMVVQIEKELQKDECCETCRWLKLLQKKDSFAIALTDDWNTVLDTALGKEKAIIMIEKNVPRLTKVVAERMKKTVEEYYSVPQ